MKRPGRQNFHAAQGGAAPGCRLRAAGPVRSLRRTPVRRAGSRPGKRALPFGAAARSRRQIPAAANWPCRAGSGFSRHLPCRLRRQGGRGTRAGGPQGVSLPFVAAIMGSPACPVYGRTACRAGHEKRGPVRGPGEEGRPAACRTSADGPLIRWPGSGAGRHRPFLVLRVPDGRGKRSRAAVFLPRVAARVVARRCLGCCRIAPACGVGAGGPCSGRRRAVALFSGQRPAVRVVVAVAPARVSCPVPSGCSVPGRSRPVPPWAARAAGASRGSAAGSRHPAAACGSCPGWAARSS